MNVELSNVIFAFSLTLIAGLSTGIGSTLALLTKRTSPKLLSIALGFSAGVMLYVSFVDILVKAKESLAVSLGPATGAWAATGGFFFGILLIGVIDKTIPETENPHVVHTVEEMDGKSEEHKSKLMRMGLFTAMAL
ncbi:MAG: zinc transporter ZupT, partial [Firmicutes bacterium]|nr:zinc transporter ZupT [Bacillota bacterium]